MGRVIHIDLETTGFQDPTTDVLEIAIVDNETGNTLLHSYVKPVHNTDWPEAQRVHGITPEAVKDAPTLDELMPQIETLITGATVIAYNLEFEAYFLPIGELAAESRCCMLAWADHVGDWNDYFQNYEWHRLTSAASDICYEWTGKAHGALADTLACRAVWRYLHDSIERERVDKIIAYNKADREAKREANRLLRKEERDALRAVEDAQPVNRKRVFDVFLNVQSFDYWYRDCRTESIAQQYATLFFGRQLDELPLLDQELPHFKTRKSLLEAGYVPGSYISNDHVFRKIPKSLQPAALMVTAKKVTPYYSLAQVEACKRKYYFEFLSCLPVLDKNEGVFTYTQLRKRGMSDEAINNLRVYRLCVNGFNGQPYCTFIADSEPK